MPMNIVNTPGPIVTAIFNEAKDKALVFPRNGNLALWELNTGRKIGDVLGLDGGMIGPIFSHDGNWMAALVSDWEARSKAPSARNERNVGIRVFIGLLRRMHTPSPRRDCPPATRPLGAEDGEDAADPNGAASSIRATHPTANGAPSTAIATCG